jgi:hypothetical protein
MLKSSLKLFIMACFLGAVLADPQRGCFRFASGEVLTKCSDSRNKTSGVCYTCANGNKVSECADCGKCLSGSNKVDCENCCSACCAAYGIPHCMRKYCGIQNPVLEDPVSEILKF